jgi:hypothetical protein
VSRGQFEPAENALADQHDIVDVFKAASIVGWSREVEQQPLSRWLERDRRYILNDETLPGRNRQSCDVGIQVRTELQVHTHLK